MRLKNKVAIITGSARGIGRATAHKFAQEGAKVVVCDVESSGVDAVVGEIRSQGGEAVGFIVDVTDRPAIDRMVQAVMERYGRIDTLVNNAGIVEDAQFKNFARSGLFIMNSGGTEASPMKLLRLSFHADDPNKTRGGIYFDANPAVIPALNNFIDIEDCRFPQFDNTKAIQLKAKSVNGGDVNIR